MCWNFLISIWKYIKLDRSICGNYFSATNTMTLPALHQQTSSLTTGERPLLLSNGCALVGLEFSCEFPVCFMFTGKGPYWPRSISVCLPTGSQLSEGQRPTCSGGVSCLELIKPKGGPSEFPELLNSRAGSFWPTEHAHTSFLWR